MSPVVDWLKKINPKDIDHEAFREAVKITDVESKPMGDGQILLISEISRVTITLETSNGEKKTVKAVAKMELSEGPGREMATKFNAFTTEILMYSNILKKMSELTSRLDDKKIPWPACYYCADNKFLFEDLCESGYSIVPTYKFLDVEHTTHVMESLGKFHGLSMVMKETGLLDVNQLKIPLFATKDPMIEVMHQNVFDKMVDFIKNNWEPEWSPFADRMSKFFANSGEKIYKLWQEMPKTWDVLSHGDFTMRNMLFHYPPGSTHPDGVKFIDFQMCNYSSLGFDVGMFLYGSLLPSTRDENMTELLKAYADSLSATCHIHGYSGPIPTIDDVKSCLKSLDYITSFMAFFQLPFFLLSNKDDMHEKATEFIGNLVGESKTNPSDFIDFSDEGVKTLLKGEIMRCIKNNIF